MPKDLFLREDRIDFISAYCDRWCERCAFTSRCSSYAVHVATAMCGGDFAAGLQLAVGAPPPMNQEEARQREAFLEGLNDVDITDADMAEFDRQYEARQERIKAAPLTTTSQGTRVLAQQWLDAHGKRLAESGDGRVKAALEILHWDVFLIGVKLHRALDGRDDFLQGCDCDDDVVQNDWNGSAKVALISIIRSAAAWEVIAERTGDQQAAALAGEVRQLRREVECVFPDAWRFRRPGFDEHG